ncbi:MAG: hypothetical protein WCJ35_27350 [Planctomycetota bacterium]
MKTEEGVKGAFAPEGRVRIAQRFIAGCGNENNKSPGTVENSQHIKQNELSAKERRERKRTSILSIAHFAVFRGELTEFEI